MSTITLLVQCPAVTIAGEIPEMCAHLQRGSSAVLGTIRVALHLQRLLWGSRRAQSGRKPLQQPQLFHPVARLM